MSQQPVSPGPGERGLTLIETLVVVIAVGIMAGLALQRLLPLIGKAEVVSFMSVRNQLDSALLMETAKRIAAGRSATVTELQGSNPMQLLLRPPDNYIGEVKFPDHDQMPKRSWYFDKVADLLFYRIGDRERLKSDTNRIAFQVRLSYRDANADGKYGAAADEFRGVMLHPLDGYELTY